MANLFVRSTDGSDADNGSTWALAKATLAGAFAAAAAGDTIYVSDNHAETQASAMTLTSPGTATNPVNVLCVDDTGDPSSPTTLATTATVTTTGATTISINAFAYIYGITFSAGTGASTGQLHIGSLANLAYGIYLEACKLKIGSTSATQFIRIGRTAGAVQNWALLKNTVLEFSATGQGLQARAGRFEWINTASAVAGSVPTVLFMSQSADAGENIVSGVDLSALGSGKTLISADDAAPLKYTFTNCKLGSSVGMTTATHAGIGGSEINVINCDSADTNYRLHRQAMGGTLIQETTLVKTGGASDGTTPIAWKVTTDANAKFAFPFVSFPILAWNESTGSSKTATIEILHDSATALKDDETWLELEYLGTSGNPGSSFVSDRKASILATGADQSSSSATWTTTGMSNPNKQALAVAFTPQEKGPVRGKVCVAKASYTIYVEPLLTIS